VARLDAVVVEEAQLDPLGDLGEEREFEIRPAPSQVAPSG